MADPALFTALAADAALVTELAAIAAYPQIGRGDEKAADQVAVDAMRTALNALPIDGKVVIGEGERDEAPMLYIGEKVGTGTGPAIDVALDPLEGTTLTAKAMANALAVLAMSPSGGLLHAPDTYMDKIAVGPGYEAGIVDLDAAPQDNIGALARAKGVSPDRITACVMDRPRHVELIAALRQVGCRIVLITDGDVAGVIHTAEPETGIDIYLGQGGAPEGVLACAALKCVGGQFQGRLVFRNDDERARAERTGVTDFQRKYDLHELVSKDAVFAATGVTKGAMLDGVRVERGLITTHTLVMDSASRTVRRIHMTRPV
ncbi:MAG: class II fructose-bisphosphatase [Brevundimonas sp.]|jgi:fructose-1,6-bisphosphatase II / sedoheptulose-1,7-bisphosphatase|uniref:class II fructose-bisphosphatase n=1 Tax=Brevundimonas sp. TaxID=1871086 RepID=UPI0022BDCC29|nr:class II fructose-bisphosphatase [Brevundimonas sp.]MCZ8086492.1 class II fructose-bisphosphatase [Brevundimonas sp.]MCZ8194559.1 class II fructose-bisphosphatase [Brevundimonas sp.]